MNYLHHYSRSEQVRKRMFEGSRVFTPVLISKESQENYATLIEEGIQGAIEIDTLLDEKPSKKDTKRASFSMGNLLMVIALVGICLAW